MAKLSGGWSVKSDAGVTARPDLGIDKQMVKADRQLECMGLATEVETGKWIVSRKAEPALRELGERGDIIKTMHRALEREGLAEDRHPARYVLHRENATERIVGRVLDKGLSGAVATRTRQAHRAAHLRPHAQ
jgi:type IV secretory pathway VirD2 relaxase